MLTMQNRRHRNRRRRISSDDEDSDEPIDDFQDNRNQHQRLHHRKSMMAAPLTPKVDDPNNDDFERAARRKSRVLEPHPTGDSPCGAGGDQPPEHSDRNGTNDKRCDAAAPRTIPQAHIGEHYGNCIRLAAENKITSKNAFNLHLIDFMSDMVNREDFHSFQIASSSLDAGAKIYAGRVDAVHQETYQVLTGLGRSDKPQDNDGGDSCPDANGGDDDPDDRQAGTRQKKKTPQQRDVIQKNLAKIRSKALASKVDVDPLFQHQATAYDDGGSVELRLNQLTSVDQSVRLILDSSTRVMHDRLTAATNQRPSSTSCSAHGLAEWLSVVLPQSQLSICNSLINFRFGNVDSSSSLHHQNGDPNATLLGPSSQSQATANITKIDLTSAPSSPLLDGGNNDLFDDDNNDFGGAMDCGDDEDVNPTNAVNADNTNPDKEQNTMNDSEMFVSSLKSMLDSQYEHFGQLNDNLLGMWAGPEHWRKKAKRRKVDPVTGKEINTENDNATASSSGNKEGDQTQKGRRKAKSKVTRVSYSCLMNASENRTSEIKLVSADDTISKLEDSRYIVTSSRFARQEWPKTMLAEGTPDSMATIIKPVYRLRVAKKTNLLPLEMSDPRQSLYQLDGRSTVFLPSDGAHPAIARGQLPEGAAALHTLTAAGDGATGDLEGQDDLGGLNNLPYDEDDHPPLNDPADDDDDVVLFEDAFTQQPTALGLDPFLSSQQQLLSLGGGLDLVSAPRKVARLEINYARRAKLINVGRLKQAMWGLLEPSLIISTSETPSATPTTSSAPNPPPPPPSSPGSVASTSSAPVSVALTDQSSQQRQTMSDVVDHIISRVSWAMAKELSVAITLSCLLQICNEKSLYLESLDSLSNIVISSGMPSLELDSLQAYSQQSSHSPVGGEQPRKRHGLAGKTTHAKRPRGSSVGNNHTLDSWLDDS